MEITPIIKSNFLIFNDDEMLSSMIGKLRKYEKRSGLVFRKNKYLGVVEKKRLLRSRIDVTKTKVGKYIHRTPIINEHADVIETAYLMYQSDVDFLPVESNKQITGVLAALDLVKLSTALPETKKLKVSDIKIVKPRRVNKDDPISTALTVMYKGHFDHVPIYEGDKLYGILSYRDLMRRYLNWSPKRDISARFNKMARTKGAEVDMPSLANLPVSSFSSNDYLVTTTKNSNLREAIVLMTKKNVSTLIVMQGEEVEGLLTIKNILGKIGSLKIQQNFNIRFIGLNQANLDSFQKKNIKKIAANESFKLQRGIKNEFNLVIHIKNYSKEGKQHKYSVNLRIEFPGQIITATQSDWRIETALRKTFNNAKNKLKSKFR